MKTTIWASLLSVFVFAPGCSRAQTAPAGKVLIAYLSRTDNTKAVAEIIQANAGGKLVALELEKPYPADYQTTVQQVAKENESGYLPPLKTTVDSMENYDMVFMGFPPGACNCRRR